MTEQKNLDIFKFRDEVVGDYRHYIDSFLKIRDPRVHQFVQNELDRGQLWPDPLIQLNPTYKSGTNVPQLIDRGILHPDCLPYFSKNGKPFRFHHHQEQAFIAAQNQQPYVLTTGTGSGKSMTYVVPIFDDILRNPHIKGVRAILIYPMNALINSQKEEFDKFLSQVPNSPIRVKQYTGQEELAQKIDIQNNPPQILLTNYVMLELMLSRVMEDKLVASPDLKFLVLDELHTYRGRQGADVALLTRKLQQRCGHKLLCIGTSATMSTEGSRGDRRQTVANVASKLFGVAVKPNNVIDETLEPSIQRPYPTPDQLQAAIAQGLPPDPEQTLENFKTHPLSAWIEMNFGLAEEDSHYTRRTPISLSTGAHTLAEATQSPPDSCFQTIKQMFLWGSKTKGLAFRLHQFISQGGNVYATIEPQEKRFLTLEGQYSTTGDRLLYPLVFCRECGQDYLMVNLDQDQNQVRPALPTALEPNPEDADIQAGYLALDEPGLWDESQEDRLPDNWFKVLKKQGRVPKKEYQAAIPQKLRIRPDGSITESLLEGTQCWFIPKPFLTCLNCGVVHDRRKQEFTKLSRLSSEGRSTATTLLSLSTVNHLRTASGISPRAQKILSFTDNRQDASLQAGHFNDFVQTSLLRAALNSALKASTTLSHSQLASQVVAHMGLTQADYAKQPAELGPGKRRNENAFEKLIEYRLYEDLRRGWRIVQPNLEQCGLLKIEYEDLEAVCSDQSLWEKYPHPTLQRATAAERHFVIKAFLDQLRKELVIDAAQMQPTALERLKREVDQAIKDPWKFDIDERLHEAKWASLDSKSKNPAKIKLTPRSKIGRFLRSNKAWPWLPQPIQEQAYHSLILALTGVLVDLGYLNQEGMEIQLRIDAMQWAAQHNHHIDPDPLTSKRLQGSENTQIGVNRFFQAFYERDDSIQNMEGREHTGQVSNQDRQDRENRFREGQLATLFCSPTMELGIDISDLNVVHMRNVPPSPANYAQRSGRAGRSGQEALVITYASVGSGHDQYFFKRQEQMVAGVVAPPKLELGNQELIQAHIHSIWLAHTGADLGKSMNEVLELSLDGYPLKETLRSQLTLSPEALQRCLKAGETILADPYCSTDLNKASWYTPEWLPYILEHALITFDGACDRWRKLYRDAVTQRDESRAIVDRSASGDVTQEDRKDAEVQEREARRQIDLLVGQLTKGKSASQLEFYPYRYLASEGFLAGYNFPRVPVRAYIAAGDRGEFISRPRVVAIREFAPTNVVYYEGSKFQIAKTKIPVRGIEENYLRVALCSNCGYFHDGEGATRDTCENCGAQIIPDNYGNPARLTRVLSMDTMLTRRRERITCDEEERLKYGYNITTHFRYETQKKESASVTSPDDTKLLKLSYGETAKIWRINRGLQRGQERGFKLDVTTGEWGKAKDSKNEPTPDSLQPEVHLMVEDTCNILLIEICNIPETSSEPVLASLQYALQRSVQAIYKLEEEELASERLGKDRYILFWEAAEGGAGVLSQILDNPQSFQALANKALEICHFQEAKDTCTKACYECLLSYRNQLDHPILDRHLLRPYLEQLAGSTLHRHEEGLTRKEQYQHLHDQTDPNSEFERTVLKEIFQQGMKLPDSAQEFIPEANCKPDFFYRDTKVAIFCDGSVHAPPDQQKQDQAARDHLKYTLNHYVIVCRYDEDWQGNLATLSSLVT